MTAPLTTRCTTCRAEFTDEQIAGVGACPECGTKGLPMLLADDVTLKINWHELRVLTIWASNYATAHCDRGSREALAAILHSLALQHPDKAPLTLAGDVGQLREAIESGEIPAGGLEMNVRDLLDDGGERPQ